MKRENFLDHGARIIGAADIQIERRRDALNAERKELRARLKIASLPPVSDGKAEHRALNEIISRAKKLRRAAIHALDHRLALFATTTLLQAEFHAERIANLAFIDETEMAVQ